MNASGPPSQARLLPRPLSSTSVGGRPRRSNGYSFKMPPLGGVLLFCASRMRGIYWQTMRQSQLFTKTRREAPADEVAKNAQLLIRAGYIHKEMAGVYDLQPLGLRTFNKVVGIIREGMNKIGGIEMHLTALQNPELWQKTDRWTEKVDNWF